MRRLLVTSVLLASSIAQAGGMVLPVRGVRALERAGALIAGADDADALWLDPAGLGHLAGDGHQALLFDVAYVYQPVTYTRIDSGGNMLPAVSNQQPGSPIPTLAGAIGIGDRFVLAGGITAPYAGLHRYDDAGSQRYASVSLAGSTFVIVTVGAAFVVSPRLRVGATVQDVVSNLDARVVMSACPSQTVCAPEDPALDAAARIQQSDYVAPSGSIGVQYDVRPMLTLGATLQAPTRVSSMGTLTTQLPSSALFDGAMVVGDRASLSFTLPASVRAGVEWRPSPQLRVEAALDVELWSMHDRIDLVPDHVSIEHAPGVGTYAFQPMQIPRHYRTSFAPALGAEYHTGSVTFGAGASYETAAAPRQDVSVLTVDSSKLLVGLGGGYAAEGWQIGAAAGYVKLADIDVALADAQVPQLQPLRDQPAPVFINAGSYRSSYIVAGIRAARRF